MTYRLAEKSPEEQEDPTDVRIGIIRHKVELTQAQMCLALLEQQQYMVQMMRSQVTPDMNEADTVLRKAEHLENQIVAHKYAVEDTIVATRRTIRNEEFKLR